MQRFPRYCLLAIALVATTLLTLSLGQRIGNPAPDARSLDDWDIPELAIHLNLADVEVRLCSPQKYSSICHTAFLTTTDKGWDDLNLLIKDPSRLPMWRGTVYCERVTGIEASVRAAEWGDPCLVIGPFVFYGDAELLERIRAALDPLAPFGAP